MCWYAKLVRKYDFPRLKRSESAEMSALANFISEGCTPLHAALQHYDWERGRFV